MEKVCKVLNYLGALALIFCFVWRCKVLAKKAPEVAEGEDVHPVKKPKDPFYYILALYLLPFSLLLVTAELNFRPVIKYVNFLKG